MASGQIKRIEKIEADASNVSRRKFNIAGILPGLGLGGFFDGIVIHQLLQDPRALE